MTTASKTIQVNAPVDLIWSYVENPLQVAAMSGSLSDVRDLTPSDVGGYNCTLVYNIGGRSVDIALHTTEYIRNERLVTRLAGALESVQTWAFRPSGRGTKVNLTVDYQVDARLLSQWNDNIAEGRVETDIDQTLIRLKDVCEALSAQFPDGL